VRKRIRRQARGSRNVGNAGSMRISVMSMKSSSPISSLVLIDNRLTVTMVDRAMLRNKISKVLGSISIRSGTLVKKSRVMGWNFMEKMCM
jgi:hypothetical protein